MQAYKSPAVRPVGGPNQPVAPNLASVAFTFVGVLSVAALYVVVYAGLALYTQVAYK